MYFEGSVPLSISLVVKHSKNLGNTQRLEDNIRHNFGLVSPSKSRENVVKSNEINSFKIGNLGVYWTFNKGDGGLEQKGKVSDIQYPIVGFFKLKYSLVMILTEQKVAIVYGKSYDQKGTFRPVVVTSTDLNRYLSPYDKLIGTCICKKEFLVI